MDEKNENTQMYSISCCNELLANSIVEELNKYVKNVLGHSEYERAYVRKDIRVYVDRRAVEATYEVCKKWGLFEKENQNGSQKTSD